MVCFRSPPCLLPCQSQTKGFQSSLTTHLLPSEQHEVVCNQCLFTECGGPTTISSKVTNCDPTNGRFVLVTHVYGCKDSKIIQSPQIYFNKIYQSPQNFLSRIIYSPQIYYPMIFMSQSMFNAFLIIGSSSSASVEVERMVPSRSMRYMAPPALPAPFLRHTPFSSFSSNRLGQG